MQLIAAYARKGNLSKVEGLIDEAVKAGLSINKSMYNGIIQAYCKLGRPLDAEKALLEMREIGMYPDSANYTTVINAYKKKRYIDKCWNMFKEADING